MKIVLPGGSGHLGTLLARTFAEKGHEVVVLSRRPLVRPWRVEVWDGSSVGTWCAEIDGCDAVINLAGRSVDCRYHERHRREILQSRVESTRVVGQAIAAARRPPRVWLQSSTATIYAHRYDTANDEASGILGGDEAGLAPEWRFSLDVARAWEQALADANTPRTRKVALRSAMTMSAERGGVFAKLLTLVKLGLGGTAGDGRQFVSWIHGDDFARAVQWLIEHSDLEGVVNVAAPHPLPNRDFMQTLRGAAGVRVGLPARAWMLEVGAWFMRTESELLLKSRRVVPGRLQQHGFQFQFPIWQAAAADLCRRMR